MNIDKSQKITIIFKGLVGDEFYQNSTIEEQVLDKKSEEIAYAKANKVADILSDHQNSCRCEKEIIITVNTQRGNANPSIKVEECCPISVFEIQNRLKNIC